MVSRVNKVVYSDDGYTRDKVVYSDDGYTRDKVVYSDNGYTRDKIVYKSEGPNKLISTQTPTQNTVQPISSNLFEKFITSILFLLF